MENKHLFKNCESYKRMWSYFNTVKTWLQEKDNENVLILHFNDLKKEILKKIYIKYLYFRV